MGSSTDCPRCGGDGIFESEECVACQGLGIYQVQSMQANMLVRLSRVEAKVDDVKVKTDNLPTTNVFWSYQVWEATDMTEYLALSDELEASYNKIVHMGTVDLNVGSNSRAVIWRLFDAESTTRAALLALIT